MAKKREIKLNEVSTTREDFESLLKKAATTDREQFKP